MTTYRSICAGMMPVFFAAALLAPDAVRADNVVPDDQIVQGSQCVGVDCVNNENFGFDTLRLKENNLRIDFNDTSSTGSFPTNDWGIVINDSNNGGSNYFMIQDRGADGTASDSVLRIDAGADGAITLGYGAQSSGSGTVSFGHAGDERRLTNVAAGVNGTDAANVDQVNAGDATTLSQANAYTDMRMNSVGLDYSQFKNDVFSRIDRTNRRLDRSGAMGTAMAQMTASAAAGRTPNRLAVGVGYQGGQKALSVGYQRNLGRNSTFTLGAAFSGSERTAGFGVSTGW